MKILISILAVTFLLSTPAIAQDRNEWQSWPLEDHFTATRADAGCNGFFLTVFLEP